MRTTISPVAGRRHRIEHCGECPPYLLERIKKLGVVIVTQPPFIYYSGERYLATVPESQQPWLYRIKSPLESGVVVAGSSDAPVVPNNPLMGIYAAVTRQAESGQVLLPEERITAAAGPGALHGQRRLRLVRREDKRLDIPGQAGGYGGLKRRPHPGPPGKNKRY